MRGGASADMSVQRAADPCGHICLQKNLIAARHNNLKMVQRNNLMRAQRENLMTAQRQNLMIGPFYGRTAGETG
jgi:hypothetical protein